MEPTPRLLETYEEARLLLEAKGWGIAKAAEHLSEMRELARFNISQTKLSKRTTPGSKVPIEPEVAAAVEGMQTWRGYERQVEIVTKGLLALHGDPSIVDVGQVAADLRELPASGLAPKLVEALEEKAGRRAASFVQEIAERAASELTPKLVEAVGEVAPKLVEAVGEVAPKLVEAVEALEEKTSQRADSFFQKLAERFGRTSGKQIAISAGSGALVGCCLALAVAPLLPVRADAATQPGPLVVIIPDGALDGSPLRFEPESLLAAVAWGEKMPAEQQVPKKTLPGQKVAPCDAELGEVAINGNCWAAQADVKPPCGRLFRHGDKCYRPIAAEPKKPAP
jgi:hypothetical protein